MKERLIKDERKIKDSIFHTGFSPFLSKTLEQSILQEISTKSSAM